MFYCISKIEHDQNGQYFWKFLNPGIEDEIPWQMNNRTIQKSQIEEKKPHCTTTILSATFSEHLIYIQLTPCVQGVKHK